MSGLDLAAVRLALAAAVDTVPAIKRTYHYIVAQVEDTPAAYIGMADPIEYHRDFARGGTESTIPVVLVVGRVNHTASQELLDELVSWPAPGDEPDSSVVAAIEADRTLGGACDTLRVDRAHHLRAVTIGGTDHIAIDLDVVVFTSARRRRAHTPDPDS